jgi:mono/diheme cytochrome c family protein
MRKWIVLLALSSGAVAAQEADRVSGKATYDHWCRPCHDIEPRKHPGTAALQVLYKGEKPAALEQRLDLTPELIATYVRTGVSIMPFFRKTEISDAQLSDLGAYLSKAATQPIE